ncbi:hypothetical protein NMG60_11003916 [Bertholletia excelsa]
MESNKKASNKISETVKLQRILKKWKKLALSGKSANKITSSNVSMRGGGGIAAGTTTSSSSSNNNSSSKSINKILKKTLSSSESSSWSMNGGELTVPKGHLAVGVGEEEKRYVIPTHYLAHKAFQLLLREAEEEFGFEQEGILKLPCQVPVFDLILKLVQDKRDVFLLPTPAHIPNFYFNDDTNTNMHNHEDDGDKNSCSSCSVNETPETTVHHQLRRLHSDHPQLCR